ncbi:MAG: MFS transporter [Chitinophagaceae bacterium]|nr:MFS transporter [Chitinophagaceae bacterium]MCW5928406.1 MFS transporter [Chitinophagaceae bacterium]
MVTLPGKWSQENNLLRAVFFFAFASLGCWMPNFNLWLEDRGMSGSVMGYISAIPWLVMLVVQPLWGIIADKNGKMRCFNTAVLAAAFLFSVFPIVAREKLSIGGFTFLLAVFQTPILPLLDSLTLDHVSRSQNASYSRLRFWGAPGFGAGAWLTGILSETYGNDVVFYLGAAFLLITWIIAKGLLSHTPSVSAADISFRGLKQTLENKMLLTFLVIVMVVSIAQSASSFFLTVYMREIGASSSVTGTAIGVQALSELPFYFIAAWLLRKTSAANVLQIAIWGTAVRLLLYYLNGNPYMVIGIETLNGVTWTLLWIASVEFVNHKVPAAWRTTGQSLLWAMYFGAGAVLGNILIGRLYESLPMRQIFGIFSMIVWVVALAFLLLIRGRKKDLQ